MVLFVRKYILTMASSFCVVSLSMTTENTRDGTDTEGQHPAVLLSITSEKNGAGTGNSDANQLIKHVGTYPGTFQAAD